MGIHRSSPSGTRVSVRRRRRRRALLAVVLIGSSWVNFRVRVCAESAYAAYLKGQDEKRCRLANRCRRSSRRRVSRPRAKAFDDALAQVNVALDYDPEHGAGPTAEGALAGRPQAFRRSAVGIAARIRNPSRLTRGPRNWPFVPRPRWTIPLSRRSWRIFSSTVPGHAGRRLAPGPRGAAIHRQKIDKAWPGLDVRLTMDRDGRLLLNLSNRRRYSTWFP